MAGVKRRGFLPSGTGLSSSEILQYASDELGSYIPAFLKSIREEFIVASLRLAVTSGTVAAPARAVGAALRTIGWLQADGRVRPLNRIEPENAGEPVGYMFQGNNVLLLPAPTSGTLCLTYQQRPGQLVLPTECALVTEISGLGVTVEAAMSDWTDSMLFDVVSASPNFVALALDVTVADADESEIFFSAIPTGMAVGDYICLAGETCIPQIPTEVHDLLAQAAAVAIANSTGSERLPAIKAKFTELENSIRLLLSPRSDGSARPIVSRSRIGRWNMGW